MDTGAEIAAGEHGVPGQSPVATAGLGKGLSTNWFRAGSGNLATGLASEAPSFRSSWQSQLNASRGVSRGTNGVEGEEASESGTVDAMRGTPMSRTAQNGLGSVSVPVASQAASSSIQLNGAATKQSVSISDADSQNETWSDTGRPAWKAMQNAPTLTASTGNTDVTPTERSGAANRSRAGSATPPAKPEKTAQAATVGAQVIAPTFEAPIIELPIQVPAAPVRSEIPTLAQTAGITSAPELNRAPANWRSTQVSGSARFSGSAPLSGPAQLSEAVEIASTATGSLAPAAPGSAAAAGVRTQTMRTGPAFVPRNATEGEAMHKNEASSLGDSGEPAATQSMSSPSSPEARSAELRRGSSIAQTAGANQSLSGQTVPNSSTGNLDHPATVASVAPSAAALATVSGAAQASSDTLQDASKQFSDRATSRAANHDATRESVASAAQVSAVQPTGPDAAASSGLRIPGAAPISTAPGAHDQPLATAASAATTTQDRFAALDAGSSPGTPAWTQGGSQHAEAGFRDPTLGWVSVRADLDAGGIHATLVPSSAEAAQALNGHLAGLSTHLVEQQSPVASLTMASPSQSGVENGMGQRMQQGAEGNPQGNAHEDAQAGSLQNASPASTTSVLNAPAQAGIRASFAQPGDLRGTHISVMA
jgi:hypothetical protein